MKTSVLFIVAKDIKSLQKRSLRVKWYQAVRIGAEVQILCERTTMLLYTYLTSLVKKNGPISTKLKHYGGFLPQEAKRPWCKTHRLTLI
jgi:hypothetical protein